MKLASILQRGERKKKFTFLFSTHQVNIERTKKQKNELTKCFFWFRGKTNTNQSKTKNYNVLAICCKVIL